jgi:Fe-Mn family superoxide dismutase
MTAHLVLPELAFAYDALEPWCSAETLHLHHDKHHRAYVDGANAAAEALATVDPKDAHTLAGIRTALEFNTAGHVMHSLFWETLAPVPTPKSEHLERQVARDFGSWERFEQLFIAACTGVQGSGWGALAVDPASGTLTLGGVHDHQNQLVPNSSLIAVIDVWEHAYYLDHRNDRPGWAKAALAHLDWTKISARFEAMSGAMISSS